jgi:hypothetical protein
MTEVTLTTRARLLEVFVGRAGAVTGTLVAATLLLADHVSRAASRPALVGIGPGAPLDLVVLRLRAVGEGLGGSAAIAVALGLLGGAWFTRQAVAHVSGRPVRRVVGGLVAIGVVGAALAAFAGGALALGLGAVARWSGLTYPSDGPDPMLEAAIASVSALVALASVSALSLVAKTRLALGGAASLLRAWVGAASDLAGAPRVALALVALRFVELLAPLVALVAWRGLDVAPGNEGSLAASGATWFVAALLVASGAWTLALASAARIAGRRTP